MFSRLSVTKKGLAAFFTLALVGVVAGAVSYDRARTAEAAIEEAGLAQALVVTARVVESEILSQAFALQSFLLTGERGQLADYESRVDVVASGLDGLAQAAPDVDRALVDAVVGARTSWEAWRRDYVAPQVQRMRDPMSVDLARAVAGSPAAESALERVREDVAALEVALGARVEALVEAQREALSVVELFGLGASLLIVAAAIVLASLNYATISRPLRRLADATERLAAGDLDAPIAASGRGDEIGRMSGALAVFREGLARTRALEGEASETRKASERRRRAELEELAAAFEASVLSLSQDMQSETARLGEAARSLRALSARTREQAVGASASSGQTAANVGGVASAAEELSASISEITTQVGASSRMAIEASEDVARSNEAVSNLNGVVEKIGDVTKLISEIAAQTNLLALNATIEAARAGEAGKGFAVVAAEVKSLADQTGKATEDIERQIAGMRAAAQASMKAAAAVAGKVEAIAERMNTVAAAAEEQNATTGEIARSVALAASAAQEVSRTIDAVSGSAGETGSLGERLEASSGLLEERGRALRGAMESFVARVRAA